MDISIIIPVYNAEKYLERCVKSVLAALEHFEGNSEILLVDNNSSDKSLLLAEKLKKDNPKLIKILKCASPGAAAVRNYGFKKASGEYVWFIDADDEITPDSINILMDTARTKDSDLVMLGAKRFFANGNTQYLRAIDADDPDLKSIFIRYGMGPWQVLIKRSWFSSNHFEFKEGMIHEDMEMMPVLILYTDKYTSVDKPLYYYYENPDSVLHKSGWDPHSMDIFPALEGLMRRFKKADAGKKYHDELEWFFIWNLMLDSAKDFTKGPDGKQGFLRTREIMKKYFPKWRKNRFFKKTRLRTRLRIIYNYYK